MMTEHDRTWWHAVEALPEGDKKLIAEVERNAADYLAIGARFDEPPAVADERRQALRIAIGRYLIEARREEGVDAGVLAEVEAWRHVVPLVRCEACEAKYPRQPDYLHYYSEEKGGATWGVCRKFVAAMNALQAMDEADGTKIRKS
jgi:hypothetical protein